MQPRKNLLGICEENPLLFLVLLTVAANVLIIANPGFFNHDEWQKIDYIRQHGLLAYARDFFTIPKTTEFGHPVRPLGFLVQGIFAVPMESLPAATHLLDVLLHAAIVCLVWAAARRVGIGARASLLGAALFAISPLTTFSVGWAGALHDRLYIFFALLTVFAVSRHLSAPRFLLRWPLGILFCAVCAMLSKETAIALPLFLAGLLFAPGGPFAAAPRERRLAAVALAATPVGLFLLIRLPALLNSMAHRQVTGTYAPSSRNIPSGILTYLAYPFMPRLNETINIVFVEPRWIWISAAVHLFLLGAIYRIYGARGALRYVFCYFVFLLPVLSLPSTGGHYMYFSAIPLALAIACLLFSERAARALKAALAVLAVALCAHGISNQIFLYDTGQCQVRLLHTLDGALVGETPRSVTLLSDKWAPTHVVVRTFNGRSRIGDHENVEFHILPFGGKTPPPPADFTFHFSPSCLIYKK